MSQRRSPQQRSEPPTIGHDDDIAILLRRGEAAQREYDFDEARNVLTQAVARSRGAAGPVRALLGLLVDCLGADTEAVHIVSSLSAAARADPEVRLLGSLAAARAGDRALASRLLGEVEHPRVSEVYVPLCQAALAEGDLAEAARCLDLLRAQDPPHSEIPTLSAELDRRRQDERLPLEVQLLEYVEARALDHAAPLARQILARWPESDIARRILREAEVQRRDREARHLLSQAQAVALENERPQAIHLLTQALALCEEGAAPLREEIRALLLELRDKEQAARQEDRVAECLATLERDEAAGLVLYLELPPSLRARVLELAPKDAMAWLEQLGPRAAAHPRAAAEAVLALAQAEREQDPTLALHLLDRHERLLSHLPDAVRLQKQHMHKIEERALEQVRSAIAQAGAAHDRGEFEQGQALLGGVSLRGLPPEEVHAAEALRGRLQEALEVQKMQWRIEHLCQTGDPLEARGVVDQLIARVTEEERTSLLRRREELGEEVRRTFAVEICDEAEPPPGFSGLDVVVRDREQWTVLPDGDLLTAQSWQRWVFLWVLTQKGAVRRRARLRTPTPLDLESVEANGAGVYLMGEEGALLHLTWPGLEVARFYRKEALNMQNDEVSSMGLSPDGTSVWIETEQEGFRLRVRVADLERPRVQRQLGERETPMPIHDARQPAMVCGRDDTVFLYDGRGTLRWELPLPDQQEYGMATVHPGGDGIFLMTAQPDGGLSFCTVSAAGKRSALQPIADSIEETVWEMATTVDQRIALVHFSNEAGEAQLLGLRPARSGEMETAYRVRAPGNFLLVSGAGSRRAAGVYLLRDRLEVVALGVDPPRFPEDEEAPPEWTSVVAMSRCMFNGDVSRSTGLALRAALHSSMGDARPDARWREMHRRWERSDDPDERLAVVQALELDGRYRESASLLDKMAALYPSHAETQVMKAERLTYREDWTEVRQRLEPLYPDQLLDLEIGAQHALHLLGISLLMAGECVLARKVLGEALALDGECHLEQLQEMLREVSAAGSSPETSVVLQLRAAIAKADLLLEKGEWAAAQAALATRSVIWQAGEVQSLARLCQAYLEAPPPGGVQRFRAAQAMAFFCAAHGATPPYRRELPLPEGHLHKDVLDPLVLRADAWLSQRRTA